MIHFGHGTVCKSGVASSPTRCLARAQIGSRAMHKLFSLGHFPEFRGELVGERHSEPCLSCTVHPRAGESNRALFDIADTSTSKEASKMEKLKRKV